MATINFTNISHTSTEKYLKLTYPAYRESLQNIDSHPNLVAIAANKGEQAVGLVLAGISTNEKPARILSLFVVPDARRQGIGSELLTAMETELKQRGCEKIELIYLPNPTTPYLNKILVKNSWNSPQTRLLTCLCTRESIKDLPLLKIERKMPPDYQIFPWLEITADERKKIIANAENSPWNSLGLNPFVEEDIIEPIGSLGLRYKGEVVGWMVTHRVTPDTIRYTSLFVNENLQTLGRGIDLIIRAINLQRFHDKLKKLQQASFAVGMNNPKMVQFTERRLKPYCSSFRQSFGTLKSFE
ncbi:GNAT family N-acetyltransferase [Chrysosporum bergii ANA360D]|uniref:GNAT family N-acetyltransferase n=1 Tax=Chrysosporum bergii ANA360D TaxID=617107 RepID=A0AA43GUD5_9CYAN|nr:GNAT family N-acetyltransferase [Chrysosporum bergii]MDH6061501.1 GNAT family N-acetyltransferase [Chrysosporum bergii ANA360D]